MNDYVAKPISFSKLEEILEKWTHPDGPHAAVDVLPATDIG
jgi:hypothetical protein